MYDSQTLKEFINPSKDLITIQKEDKINSLLKKIQGYNPFSAYKKILVLPHLIAFLVLVFVYCVAYINNNPIKSHELTFFIIFLIPTKISVITLIEFVEKKITLKNAISKLFQELIDKPCEVNCSFSKNIKLIVKHQNSDVLIYNLDDVSSTANIVSFVVQAVKMTEEKINKM